MEIFFRDFNRFWNTANISVQGLEIFVKQDMVTHTCNLSTWKVREFWVSFTLYFIASSR